MAKSINAGQIILDSAGQGVGIDTASGPTSSSQIGEVQSFIRAQSISIHPSTTSWVVVLNNQDGSTAFTAQGSDAVSRTYEGPFNFRGVVLQTATNITRVMLHDIDWVRS